MRGTESLLSVEQDLVRMLDGASPLLGMELKCELELELVGEESLMVVGLIATGGCRGGKGRESGLSLNAMARVRTGRESYRNLRMILASTKSLAPRSQQAQSIWL